MINPLRICFKVEKLSDYLINYELHNVELLIKFKKIFNFCVIILFIKIKISKSIVIEFLQNLGVIGGLCEGFL